MALELFVNSASSTTTGSIDSSTDPVTVAVASATTFPSSGNFRILIDQEILLVTAVSGTNFTASRAQEGTTIASHTSGATVTHVLTKQSLANFWSDRMVLDKTWANRPAAGIANRIFKATDHGIWSRDTGSVWVNFLPDSPDFTTPDDSVFSWVNQGSCTVDTTGPGILLTGPANSTTNSFRIRIRSHTAPKKYTAAFYISFRDEVAGGAGLCWRESSTGKIMTHQMWGASGGVAKVFVEKWTDPTTFNGSITSWQSTHIYNNRLIWFQVEDDNTNLHFRHSLDGVNFIGGQEAALPVTRTSFMSGGPNGVGFFINPNSQIIAIRLLSWKEE